MKITLNLSPTASLRDRYALTWAVPATVIGLIALILLCRASLREYRNFLGIQSQLTEVQLRSQELSKQEALIRSKFEDPKSRQLLDHAKFVNSLIDQKKLSLTELSSRVAGLLPGDAQLTGLGLTSPKKPGDDYTVRLGIGSRSEDSVETFINDLEDSPDFKDVSIISQGFQEETAQGEQVNVLCTARYLPGAEAELEAESQPEAASQKPAAGSQKPKVASQPSAAVKGPKATKQAQKPLASTKSDRTSQFPARKPAQ